MRHFLTVFLRILSAVLLGCLFGLAILMAGCSRKSSTESIKPGTSPIENTAFAFSPADSALLRVYNDELSHTDKFKARFIHKIIQTMYEFNGRAKDTIIYTLGNISGSDIADTIKNHVYILNDTVIVESWWIKNNDTLWHYEYGDEFVDNTGSELSYDPDEQGIWATFTTGIYFVIPDLTPTTSGMDSAMIVDNGLSDLRKLGINVTGKDYATFLHRFHGDVISFGEPEREDSWIWYGPAKRFVHYYIP